MRANRKIEVDLVPGGINERLRLSQYDTDYKLVFDVYDAGVAVAFDAGMTVTLVATKPSGLGFTVAGTWYQNTVTIPLEETITEEAGTFAAELVFVESGKRVGCANFDIWVEASAHPDGTTDGDTETARTLLEQMEAAVGEAETAAEDAQAAAATVMPTIIISSDTEPVLEADAQSVYVFTNPVSSMDLTPASNGITSVFFPVRAGGCTLTVPSSVTFPPGIEVTTSGGYSTVDLPGDLNYELNIFQGYLLVGAWA